MASGDEGVLTISIGMRVSPEPEAIELLRRYNVALNYAMNKILRLNLKKVGEVHNALYREFKEWFGLPSRIAVDCYRDALANANAWRNNPRRGRRRPRVRKLSMLLHQGSGYRVKEGYVEIIGGIKLRIIGWDGRYDQYENGEARLVYRDGKMMLWISKRIPKPKPYQPRDAIAVDINEKKIVYGDHVINGERDTKIDEAHRWKLIAESLQKKYSSPKYPAWRRRRGILNRIRSYHRKARDILEDWARKTSLEIVRFAKKLGYAVAREDLTGLINSLRKIKNKDHRTKLIIMGYARLERWIDWQTMKHGVPLAIVNPNGTSSECPKCDSKLEETGYRRLRCPRCEFKADRDVIGKLNIRKRALKKLGINPPGGVLAPLTAPQMTDVNPNRWGNL
ncbi:MAG: zinc ribbon domain-containing protein [Desulfurococcales archaeon]|nr:zinc ribbon domain-containing protein [Desulfurococcales archaeon]